MVKLVDKLSKVEKETVETYKDGLDVAKNKIEGYKSSLDEISHDIRADICEDIDDRTTLAIGLGALLTVAVIGTAVYFGLKSK